jgi:hypothetical protein
VLIGTLVIEQLSAMIADDTGRRIDGKSSAGVVIERVRHLVARVSILVDRPDSHREAGGGVLNHLVHASNQVGESGNAELVLVRQIDASLESVEAAVIAGCTDGHQAGARPGWGGARQ